MFLPSKIDFKNKSELEYPPMKNLDMILWQYGEKLTKIYKLADSFRKAIEKAKKEGELKNIEVLKEFPLGSCGTTCELLGYYLFEKGISCEYVSGEFVLDNGTIITHAWLRSLNTNLIIDITGDQFVEYKEFGKYIEPVYVGQMDDFHKMFNDEENDRLFIKNSFLNPNNCIIYNELKQIIKNINKKSD